MGEGRRGEGNPVALPFLISLGVTMLVFWTVDIVSPAIPNLKTDLGLSAKLAGMVFAALFLGRLIGNFPAARLVETIGAGKTGAVGAVVLGVGSFLIAIAPTIWLVLPGRMLQGVGIAFTVNAVLRSLLRNRPGRGAAITFFQFSATLGTVLGLQVGGAVTEAYGWRAVFFLSVAIAAAICLVALFAPKAHPPMPAQTVDHDGTDQTRAINWPAALPALGYNFLVFANYGIFMATPLYAERHFHASPKANANLLMVITVMHLVGAFPSGRAIRTRGARPVLAIGIALSCVAMLLIPLAPSTVWIAPGLAIYGLGMITASNAAGDSLLEVCGGDARAIGLLRLTCDLGLVIGPFAVGALADSYGYRAPFVVLPILSIVPILLAFRRSPAARAGVQIGAAAP